MRTDRARAAEEWLGWSPIPQPPAYFSPLLTAAGCALADYVEGDRPARRRLAQALDEVVAHPGFSACGRRFQVAVLTRAGIAHNWCGVGEADDAELLVARELLVNALHVAPAGGTSQAWIEYGLANTLVNLYQRVSDEGLLDSALDHARRSVVCAGHDRRLAALCQSGLASVLHTCFRVHGDATTLAEAVEHAEWAVTTAGETQLGHRFKYILAELLAKRYDTRGSLDDLNHAIELLRSAGESRDYVMAPRSGNAFRGSLGSLLRRLYLRTRQAAVIDEAVRLLTEEVGSDDAQADPISLGLLGNALLTRYQDFGDGADLLRAVDLQMKVLSARRAGDWQLASGHNNAGNALASAWRATGNDQLGEMAVEHYRMSLRLTAEDAQERASRAYNLGSTLQARIATSRGGSVDEAVAVYRDAVHHGLDTSLEWALTAARQWGSWAVARGCWEEACTAYTSALEATERLFKVQLLREDKETWLTESQGLSSNAAYALFRAGRQEEAVVALEAGRSLLLSEALEGDRTSLGRLADLDHASLIDRYQAAVTALDEAMRDGARPAILRHLRAAVDDVIVDIRSIDGYTHFLARPRFADVRRAVPPGAVIVYLAASDPAGVAFAVNAHGRISAVELPLLTAAAVEHRVRALLGARRGLTARMGAWRGMLDAVTRWVWTAVVSHVLPLVGDTEDIAIVPCGKLAFLPLHAAWRPVPESPRKRHYLLDERTVRYVPNARALEVTHRTAARTSGRRIVVVADPRPTSWPSIGYAQAEAAWARRWFPQHDVLRGEAANHTAVTAALSQAQVHHLICHGRSDTDHPMDSSLLLANDQKLTLREILSLRQENPAARTKARLTVLSACDTDRPGTALPDEVVSLPSGLIQAGTAGVVASQWAVRSEAMSLLMARFYQLWRTEFLEPATALRNAQCWLRDTTNQEKVRDLALVLTSSAEDEDAMSLVRNLRLRDPQARPYQHPADWAALGYHGS